MTPEQRACLVEALVAGHAVLGRRGSSLAAVEAAIRVLEASGLFNAGLGARVQLDGVRRMDASLMEGRRLRAGAVAGIEGVRHPITAARLVMDKTPHVLLVGEPATRFARHFQVTRQPRRPGGTPPALGRGRRAGQTLRLFRALGRVGGFKGRTACGTVGAVAIDVRGTVAAGASTGGIGLMLPGRVGDSPLIGAGVYADDEAGAVSMTGMGESVIRLAVAKEIVERLAEGASPAQAARAALERLVRRVQGQAGALVLDRRGRFAIRHVTPRMAAGYWDGRGDPVVKDRFP